MNINIKMISTSEVTISCLLKADAAEDAVKALCKTFDLESDLVAVVNGDLPNV